MEDIKDVVDSIVRGCALGGLEVPELLAAFVARTVVESNASSFSLDNPVTPSRREEVIVKSIERLLERDNPALETMKMQVDYDTAFLKEDVNAQRILRMRNKMIATHKMGIVEVVMEDAHDFEALTSLYRKIFRFLLEYAPNSKSHDRLVEREVAAALESVFPRIGLKAFLGLGKEERSAQLLELGRITLGIRLFNREQGRGGAGIDAMDKDSRMLAKAMVRDIDREAEFFADACNKYQMAIVRAHCETRKVANLKAMAAAKAEAKNARGIDHVEETEPPITVDESNLTPVSVVERWGQELANRRQYLSFLRTLQDEVHSIEEKVSQLGDSLDTELANIKTLVTNKSSVPKEQVYPRFDALGYLWVRLFEEVTALTARANTFRALCVYRLSFNPTLTEEYYDEKVQALSLGDSTTMQGFATGAPTAVTGGTDGPSADAKDEPPSSAADAKEGPRASDMEASSAPGEDEGAMPVYNNGVTLLSVHNTPDFMLLPLELQGFCPWTIVHAKGLLISGKPNLSVVRYDNMYFVCDHEMGLRAFMKNPDWYLNQIRMRALHHPEYIHLLKLQAWFPSTSIARLLEQNDFDQRAVGGQPATKDAATSTPTHFVENYIDVNYHWNEWELRRRALKVVALKGCATTGAQTDNSHFRRDNETQVYEQRQKDTQTRKDSGTNPPAVTTYVAGLRGQLEPEAKAVSKYILPDDEERAMAKAEGKEDTSSAEEKEMSAEQKRSAPRVVHLSLDF